MQIFFRLASKSNSLYDELSRKARLSDMSGGGEIMNDSHQEWESFQEFFKVLFMGQLRKFEIIICHNLGTFFLDMKNCKTFMHTKRQQARSMENTVDIPYTVTRPYAGSATLTRWRRTHRSGEGKMIALYGRGICSLSYRSFP